MDFAKFFVDRPIFAAVLSILIFVAGAITIPLLPVSEYPDVVPPTVQVRAVYPGANPREIAETVATPLEEAITGVEDLMYMKAVAGSDGVLALTLTFRPGTAPDAAQAMLFCAGDYAMRVWIDPDRAAARGLTAGDILAAIREQNV